MALAPLRMRSKSLYHTMPRNAVQAETCTTGSKRNTQPCLPPHRTPSCSSRIDIAGSFVDKGEQGKQSFAKRSPSLARLQRNDAGKTCATLWW